MIQSDWNRDEQQREGVIYMQTDELKQVLQTFGILGAGGAGFPTYAKLSDKTEIIILNCAECEPLLKVHRQLLAVHALEIAQALQTVATAIGAQKICFAVKPSYTQAVEAVQSVIVRLGDGVPMEVSLLPEVYPAGDEVITIYEVTGRLVPPGKLPIDIGVAVFNVETMYNVYRAVFEKKPVTHTYLTIAGEVAAPVTLRLPIGMCIKEVISLAGGNTTEEPVYISGGPMTGRIVTENDVIGKTTTAVLVFPKDHYVIRKKIGNVEIDMKRAMSACCQCRMCTDLCPRHLLGHPIEPHAFMRAATTGVTRDVTPFLNTFTCSQCGLCEMYACDQSLAPRKLIGTHKAKLAQNGIRPNAEDFIQGQVNPMRESRMVPMKRLISRLGLVPYDVEAPLSEIQTQAGQCEVVTILLNQHIGAPAAACVKAGEQVQEGQLIANAAEGKLSIAYHASVDGTVTEANEKCIMIRRNQMTGI